jgi:hypothetical protein
MDDWNRTGSSMSIDCPDRAKHGVFEFGYYGSGRFDPILVKRESTTRRNKARELRPPAMNLRLERHHIKRKKKFAGKSKRNAWALVTGDVAPKHTRNIALQSYLDRVCSTFEGGDSKTFLQILTVEDPQIEKIYAEASKRELEAKKGYFAG